MTDDHSADPSLTEVELARVREAYPNLKIKRDASGIVGMNRKRTSSDDSADWLLSKQATVNSDVDFEGLRTGTLTQHIAQDAENAKVCKALRRRQLRKSESLSPLERYTDIATMQVRIKPRRFREALEIPFLRMLEKAGSILDDSTQREWLDDAEQRLRSVISRIDPVPVSYGYVVERDAEGLTIRSVAPLKVAKHAIGLLSSGEWPCWDEIIEAVPEFALTLVVFDAVSQREWSRRWDMRLQQHRIQVEHGIIA